MGTLIGLIAILVFIFVCKKLSSFFFRTAMHLDEKEQLKIYNEGCIRESLESIRDSVAKPEEDSIDYRERLLIANQKISEKNNLSEAIENELGIK
jgi:uncharacterized membrane protein YhiD involved in acid resistance